jgi:hypothetical protein
VTIEIKPSHKGRLHSALHIASDKKIPLKKMESAKKNAGSALSKQITFAENARKWGGK